MYVNTIVYYFVVDGKNKARVSMEFITVMLITVIKTVISINIGLLEWEAE
jgi:hypothetical protein